MTEALLLASRRTKIETEVEHQLMVAALAHEIKNPAALAVAHISLARLNLNDAECVNRHLVHIEQALLDISDLTQEMLYASHGESQPYEIDICEMLTEILEAYKSAYPEISFIINAEQIQFLGQEQFIRIIISNLLKNSVEAVSTGENQKIAITATQEEGQLHITISDSGISNTYKPHGNGLGLIISQKLASRMHGLIDILPTGEGYTATVRLPKFTPCPSFA